MFQKVMSFAVVCVNQCCTFLFPSGHLTSHQVQIVFAGAACGTTRNEAQGLLQRLAAAGKEAFNNFEKAVESESSESVPPDGDRHKLASYVVNYIKYLYE